VSWEVAPVAVSGALTNHGVHWLRLLLLKILLFHDEEIDGLCRYLCRFEIAWQCCCESNLDVEVKPLYEVS
jgi:hypothetical protein